MAGGGHHRSKVCDWRGRLRIRPPKVGCFQSHTTPKQSSVRGPSFVGTTPPSRMKYCKLPFRLLLIIDLPMPLSMLYNPAALPGSSASSRAFMAQQQQQSSNDVNSYAKAQSNQDPTVTRASGAPRYSGSSRQHQRSYPAAAAGTLDYNNQQQHQPQTMNSQSMLLTQNAAGGGVGGIMSGSGMLSQQSAWTATYGGRYPGDGFVGKMPSGATGAASQQAAGLSCLSQVSP